MNNIKERKIRKINKEITKLKNKCIKLKETIKKLTKDLYLIEKGEK